MMTKDQAIELVNKFSNAAIHHYGVVNGLDRGSEKRALLDEVRAAHDIVIGLTGDDSISLEEVQAKLW